MENKVTIEAFKKSLPEFISLFETDKISKEYFKYEIDTLENILAKLEEGKVEIAVVGITSTGKSTMLNAILGKNLLPESPTPCTGVQVTCSYGETTKAIIDFYPDKKKRRKVVTSKIAEELFKFGDEKGNPKNKKGVMEIKLFSSNFKLNKNIVLIDTPGSDAADLESHEEITFKVVLPSAGIVMFLSTVKPISYEQNLQFIDRILSVSDIPIPLLAILNMKDAAAPKKKSGGVEKTKAEVLEEHIKKYRHLLSKCSSKFVQEATIVPISAKMAKQADDNKRWQESGMKELEEAVNSIIQATIERRILLEIERTKKKFNELKNNLKESEEQKEGLEREGVKIQKYKKEYQEIEVFIKNTERKVDDGYEKIRQKVEELKNMITDCLWDARETLMWPYGEFKSLSLEELNEKTDERVSSIKKEGRKQEKISPEFVDEFNLQLKGLFKCLDLSHQDIERPYTKPIDFNIKLEYRKKYATETHYEYVEVGPWPFIRKKRVKKVVRTYLGEAIDGNELWRSLEKLDKKLDKVKEEVKKQIKDLAKPYMKKISGVLQNREEDIERKKSLTLSSDISKAVLKKIEYFNDKVKLPKFKEVRQTKTVDFKVIEKEYECDRFAFNLYKMADKLSFKPLFLLRDKIIEEKQSKKVVVWGWNSDSMEYFEGYFLSDLIDKEKSNVSQEKRKVAVQHSQISSIEFVEEKNKIPLNIINPVNTTIFVVINTYEIGRQSFRERFLNSTLWKLKEPNIVWVMDAVKEPFDKIIDGDFCEEIKMFFGLIDSTDYAKEEIIVSSRFLYYTFIVNALRNKVPKWKTTSEKLDFNKQMVKIFKFNKHLPRLESYFSEFSKRRI